MDDPLDIMIEQKRREEEVIEGDEGLMNDINFHPTKTPSTAEHGSVKGHVSFESHSNNLNTLDANAEVTNFDATEENNRPNEQQQQKPHTFD